MANNMRPHITKIHKLSHTKEANEKRYKTRTSYPKYRLYYKKEGQTRVSSTTRKQASLDKLANLTEFHSVWFMIEYKPKEKAKFKYDGGNTFDYFRNESVVYTDLKEALKAARIFTSADEIKNTMESLHV